MIDHTHKGAPIGSAYVEPTESNETGYVCYPDVRVDVRPSDVLVPMRGSMCLLVRRDGRFVGWTSARF